MYTLEDDKETSSNLRKSDFIQAMPAQEPAQEGLPSAHTPALQQLSASFKRLTTPTKATGGSNKIALAALTIACISVFFTALDQTVVVTALPPIINDLNIGVTHLDHAAWIISAYLLGFVIAMPLMGRVSDLYGRRRIFILCLAIFGIGSVLCAIAPQLGQMNDLGFLNGIGIDTSAPGLIWLIAARFIQAVGGGAIVPVSMAIAGDFYGPEKRGLALGIIGAVTEAGGVVGPLYGAIIVQHLGWQYIFYLNIPLVIALIVAAWKFIPLGTRLHERIDWWGAALLGIALTCLSLGLAQQGTEMGPTTGSSTAQNNPIALALAVIFLIAFVLVERKVRWPVVDLSLFKRFPFTATSLVSLLVGAALIIAMADIPIYVDTVLQLPVLDSGLALLRLTAMIPIGALLGGWLCHRITCRWTGIIGLLFTAAGFYLMSRWPVQADWTQITISTVTAGFGFGLVIAPIGTTAINAVGARQAGMSSAIVTALRMVGMMLGLAALTSWALSYFKQLAAQYPVLPLTATSAQQAAWAKGYGMHLIQSAHTVYTSVFFTSMIICLVALIPACFLWGRKAAVVDAPEPVQVAPEIHEAITLPGIGDDAVVVASEDNRGEPPVKEKPNPKKRRLIIGIATASLILLIVSGVMASFMWQDDGTDDGDPFSGPLGTGSPVATAVSGPHQTQLAFGSDALTSLFVSQIGMQQGTLTDMKVVPLANDGVVLSLNLHIDANGIHRVMPVEMDGTMAMDPQGNIQIQVQRLKRDGQDAGPTAAASMQRAMNQMLTDALMPTLHDKLKGTKLMAVHTNTSLTCAQGTPMLVLLVKPLSAPDKATLPTQTLCFKSSNDLKQLAGQ